jgi:hypothetical protein
LDRTRPWPDLWTNEFHFRRRSHWRSADEAAAVILRGFVITVGFDDVLRLVLLSAAAGRTGCSQGIAHHTSWESCIAYDVGVKTPHSAKGRFLRSEW